MEHRSTAPKHLKAPTKRWFDAVFEEYQLEPHHEKLLLAAAESWDRACEAREQVAKDGPYQRDRWNQLRPHPGIAVERDAKILFARLVRELQLDSAPDDERPPRARGVG